MKVTVVIPFFQREHGLLARAVTSAINQELPSGCRVHIIVVDDGSPAPVRDENLGPPPANFRLDIIEQVNKGVGAARNAGLDAADPDTDYLAFLDSDDCWASGHLASAIQQIDAGADFYFDNNIIDEGIDAFSYSEFINERHGSIDPSKPFTGLMDGKTGFRTILHECLPHTSQVVYDFRIHRRVRFNTKLKRAGEDHMFWLSLASRSERISYSTAINGVRGEGVSIYRETLAWDSPNGFSRLVDEIVMRKTICDRFSLDKSNRRILRSDMQASCTHFLFLALRNVRTQPRQLFDALLRLTRESPTFWALMPRAMIELPNHVQSLRQRGIEVPT